MVAAHVFCVMLGLFLNVHASLQIEAYLFSLLGSLFYAI